MTSDRVFLDPWLKSIDISLMKQMVFKDGTLTVITVPPNDELNNSSL